MTDGPQDAERLAASLSDRLNSAKRAMPPTRMTDYGLAASDGERLLALDESARREWWTVAEALAEDHLERARRHADANRATMAVLEREKAAAAFNIGQLAIHRDDRVKLGLYARGTACLEENDGQPGCDYRRLALPVEGGRHVYGWEFDVPEPLGRVVMFGGLSGWGASFIGLARALNRHRLGVVLAEAPGQGQTRMLSGLHLSRSSLADASRFIEFAAAGGGPVALVGFSFGGLIAAHLAAAVPGVAALCTNGSPVAIGSLDHAAEREQFAAVFGLEGQPLLSAVRDFAFDAGTEILRCPVLALEGGADPLVAPGTWRGFAGDRDAAFTTVLWPDGLHTLYNHAGERNALIAAWIADCFAQETSR